MSNYNFSNDDKCDLRDALLQCSSIKDDSAFPRLLELLPKAIVEKLYQNGDLRVRVLDLINQCVQYRDGIEQLLWAVGEFEGRGTTNYILLLKRVRNFVPLLVDDSLLVKAHDAIKALDIKSSDLVTIYYQCLPSAFSSNMSTRQPPRAVMLCLLAGIPMQKQGIHPLTDFIVTIYKHCLEHENKLALNELDIIYQNMRRLLNLTETDEKRLIQHISSHPELDCRQHYYLMVMLRTHEQNPSCFDVKAWLLHDPMNQDMAEIPSEPLHLDNQEDKTTCTLASFGAILMQFIDKALCAIDYDHADLIIELFVPHTILGHDFESLEIRDGTDLPVKLEREYPLVMRQVERLLPIYRRRTLKQWIDRWDILQKRLIQGTQLESSEQQNSSYKVLEWFDDYQQSDDQLRDMMNILDKVPSIAFALQRTPEGSTQAKRFFFAALRTAVPVVLWYRCGQPVDINVATDLETLITYNHDIPQRLLTLRREAADPSNTNSSHIGHSITLLWENPHHQPSIDPLQPIRQVVMPPDSHYR